MLLIGMLQTTRLLDTLERVDDLLDVRPGEHIKVLGHQLTGPAVKDLDGLCAAVSL